MTMNKPNEEYYKLYGEETGRIACAVNVPEENVKSLCNSLNVSGVINEKIVYSRIEMEEYKEITKEINEKTMKGLDRKVGSSQK